MNFKSVNLRFKTLILPLLIECTELVITLHIIHYGKITKTLYFLFHY